jgi:hypothetical protein
MAPNNTFVFSSAVMRQALLTRVRFAIRADKLSPDLPLSVIFIHATKGSSYTNSVLQQCEPFQQRRDFFIGVLRIEEFSLT